MTSTITKTNDNVTNATTAGGITSSSLAGEDEFAAGEDTAG
jgi:hypothetical protein